ncbi:MAG TPA: hypothetical protein VJ754_00870, partial [Anaerolineae bacterium]|nr:hypothetical protein [Anaerolineae bacterium]
QVGEWLRAQTPADASVGVMEVGVIGYYAERRMVDFLGLLQPEVADALGRRDIYWSIPHTLPDYLVLTAINPLYSYDLLADTWFQAMYSPAAQFEDARFWGSPITVYRRRRPAIALEAQPVDQRAGPMQLSGYAREPIPIQGNTPIRIRLEWSKPDAASARVSISLIGPGGRVIASDTRAYDTAAWPAGGGSVYHTLVTGPEAPPGRYRARIQVVGEDQAGEMLVGAWKSPLGAVSLPRGLAPRADRFEDVIDLIGYRLEPGQASANAEVTLTLYWQSRQAVGVAYTVFVHLESDDGRLVLAADGQPHGGDYPTSIWSPGEIVDDRHVFRLPAGTYHLKVGLYRLETGERLTVGGADQVDLGMLTVQKP